MITTIGGPPKMLPTSVIMLTLIQCDGDTFASEENLVLLLGCLSLLLSHLGHPQTKNRAHVNFDQQVLGRRRKFKFLDCFVFKRAPL